jgi:hypothetical protein
VPFSKHFYVRLSYGSGPTLVDISESAAGVAIAEGPVSVSNLAMGGKREVLHFRIDTFLGLAFRRLPLADMNAIKTWLETHALKGLQTAVTLDRLATCGGQWEYDHFNTFFSRAELVGAFGQIAVPPVVQFPRTVLERALWDQAFVFRQGG